MKQTIVMFFTLMIIIIFASHSCESNSNIAYNSANKSVGYVKVINECSPEYALIIERNKIKMRTKYIKTDVYEGDIIYPSEKAQIIYTPNNVKCFEIEIKSQFTIHTCPKKKINIGNTMENFISNHFKASQGNESNLYSTIGMDIQLSSKERKSTEEKNSIGKRILAMLRKPIFIYIEGEHSNTYNKIIDLTKKDKYIQLARNYKDADIVVYIPAEKEIFTKKKNSRILKFYRLHKDTDELYDIFSKYIKIKTIY